MSIGFCTENSGMYQILCFTTPLPCPLSPTIPHPTFSYLNTHPFMWYSKSAFEQLMVCRYLIPYRYNQKRSLRRQFTVFHTAHQSRHLVNITYRWQTYRILFLISIIMILRIVFMMLSQNKIPSVKLHFLCTAGFSLSSPQSWFIFLNIMERNKTWQMWYFLLPLI